MFQSIQKSPFAGLTLLVSIALVSGCGGSDSDGGTQPPTDGGEVPVEGPAPETPLINASTARAIAVESLELADSLVYVFFTASSQLLNNESSPISCGASGSVTVTNGPTAQMFQFEECELGGDANQRLAGQIAFEGTFDNGFAGNQSFTGFQVGSDSRTVSIEGTANVTAIPGDIRITGADLVVDDSQSAVTLTQSALSISNADTVQQSAQLNLTADTPRFGLTGVQISSGGLNGRAVACPQSGSMTVDASTNGSLVVNGAPGGNLTFEVDGAVDTLSCNEVSIITEPSTDVPVTTPPTTPGGL